MSLRDDGADLKPEFSRAVEPTPSWPLKRVESAVARLGPPSSASELISPSHPAIDPAVCVAEERGGVDVMVIARLIEQRLAIIKACSHVLGLDIKTVDVMPKATIPCRLAVDAVRHGPGPATEIGRCNRNVEPCPG